MTDVAFRKISNSEASDWLTCKRMYLNAYVKNLEIKVKDKALAFGTIAHLALDPYYKVLMEGGSYQDARSIADATLTSIYKAQKSSGFDPDAVLTARKCLMRYFDHYEDDPSWRILKVEEFYNLSIPGKNYSIPMRLDLLVEDQLTKTIKLVDHKLTYNFWDADKFSLRRQFPLYIAILRANGIPVDGVIINQIRYREMKSVNPTDYLKRTDYKVSDTKIRNILKDHFKAADQIQMFRSLSPDAQERAASRILLNHVCKWCAFKPICETELEDGYTDQMINLLYKKNTYGYNDDVADPVVSMEDL